jgi:hypothetical protein
VEDVFNIFNAQTDDVEYYFPSWLPQDAANAAFARNPAINPALGPDRRSGLRRRRSRGSPGHPDAMGIIGVTPLGSYMAA